MSTTKNTKNTEDSEAAARAALGFVPAGKPAGEDSEAAAKKILSLQPAAPAPAKEPEGDPEPVKQAATAPEPTKPAPEQQAVKEAQAEPEDGEYAGDGDAEAVEQLDGETFSKAAVTEIAARAYKRGASSKKVKTMEEELNSLKSEIATMKREKTVTSLAAEYGLEPELLSETKLEGEELKHYAEKLAEAQPKQESFGFQSVRAAVNARAAKPMDAWSQLAAALR